MYDNIRNKFCENIKGMSDNYFLLFCAYLGLVDTEALENTIDLEKMKANADEIETDLEKGEEDVK
nr:hypothetical protein [uncultured Megasphaera sp.]